jgi:hypothetical protein
MDRNSEYSNMDHLGSPEGVDCTFLLLHSLLHSPQHSLLHSHSSYNSNFLTLTISFILLYSTVDTLASPLTLTNSLIIHPYRQSLNQIHSSSSYTCTFTIFNAFTHPMPIFSKSSHSLTLNYLLHPH